MRRLAWLLAALSLLATGCQFSKVNPQATVTITGRAVRADGSALAGVTVRLFKEADLGEAIVGIVLTLGSLGSVCLLPDAPAVCSQARTATTAADGAYRFTIKGADTQGLIGTEATMDAVVADPSGGANAASTTVTFTVRTTNVSLPDARLWNAAPHVREGAGKVHLSWTPLPSAAGTGPAYSAELFDPTRQASVWSQPASGHSADIDARLIEDRPAATAASARTSLAGATGTGSVHGVYLSSRLPLTAIAGAPPSRHRPCSTISGLAAPFASKPQPACAITDGDLLTPAHLQSPNASVVSGVVVDLGAPRAISLVVVRGFGGMFLVEVSSDGSTYRQVGTSEGTLAAVSPPGGTTGRYVRVRSPSGLDQSLMSELSVW